MKQIFSNFIATLRRYSVSSVLNILGLGVAFASLYFIGVQLSYDLTYNRDLNDSENLYRLETPDTWSTLKGQYATITARPFGNAIGEQLPQVEAYAAVSIPNSPRNAVIHESGEEVALSRSIAMASDGIVSLLGMTILEGDIEQFYIKDGNNGIVSQSVAKEYNIEIGDMIVNKLMLAERGTFKVVAIYKDLPQRSTFGGVHIIRNMGEDGNNDISFASSTHYYKMKKGGDLDQITSTAKHICIDIKRAFNAKTESNIDCEVRFSPMREIYFANDVSRNANQGKANTDRVLILIAVVIICIAFVNFINFFFALVPLRIRAVNARKIFGCSRWELIVNFIAEALGLFTCAFALAIFIVLAMQDGFITEYFDTSVLLADNLDLVGWVAILGVVASVAVALYPALYITSHPAGMVIKSGFALSRSGRILRNALLGVQFISSMMLFIIAMFMQIQYHFMLNYNIGLNTDEAYNTYISRTIRTDATLREGFNARLSECNEIEEFTYMSSYIPSEMGASSQIEVDSVMIRFDLLLVESNSLDFLDITMADGNGFTTAGEINADEAFIINETAMRIFGENDNYMRLGDGYEFAGVAKDFNYRSLRNEVEPMVFFFDSSQQYPASVLYYRLTKGADHLAVQEYIKDAVEEFDKNTDTQYMQFTSLKEQIAKMYGDERKQSRIILIFTLVSIIISLMGVFGLVLFETQFRQQEIVIRRVHGATVPEILLMINRKFLIIIAICFVMAAPVSYYIAHKWLSTFAYHIPISAWIFVVVLAVVTLVTTTIITVQSLKAANTNPAELIGKNA